MRAKRISLSKENHRKKKSWVVRWWGDYDPATDKQRRYGKSFARRRDAERFMEEKLQEFDSGMPRDEKTINLEQLCDKFITAREHELKYNTIRGYKDTMNELRKYFCPTISIKSIQPEDAQGFIASLTLVSPVHANKGKQLADSSRNKHLRQAKSLFNKAVEWNYLRINPFAKIKQVKPTKDEWHYFSPSEFRAIIEKTPNLRTRALYYVLYYCGLRSGEALNLLWDGLNIDFESVRINITSRRGSKELPPFSIKDYEVRSIPMPEKVQKFLLQLQSESEEGCPFVFLTKERFFRAKEKWSKLRESGRTKEWTNKNLVSNALRNFKRHCRNAGIKTNEKVTLHCCRKSWACNLASAGTPLQTLMKLGGWSDPTTCQQYYLKSSDENEKKAVRVLDRLARVQEEVIKSVE